MCICVHSETPKQGDDSGDDSRHGNSTGHRGAASPSGLSASTQGPVLPFTDGVVPSSVDNSLDTTVGYPEVLRNTTADLPHTTRTMKEPMPLSIPTPPLSIQRIC